MSTPSEILNFAASIPDFPITNHIIQSESHLSDVLKYHGFSPSAEAYSIVKHLNPHLPLYSDTTFPSETELRLPTTKTPGWQALLRNRELRIVDSDMRRAQDPWFEPSLPRDVLPSGDSISATKPPGVSRPFYIAEERLLAQSTDDLPHLPVEKYVFRPEDTLAGLLALHGIAPSYDAYAMVQALNPEIAEWSDQALRSRQLRIPSATDETWTRLLGKTTLWIRDIDRFGTRPGSLPRDYLTHAIAIDYYSAILPVNDASFSGASQALAVISSHRDVLADPVEAHLLHAAQQTEMILAMLATMSYASGLSVELPDEFRQAIVETASDYRASLIATASALEAGLPTCHQLLVPTPNSGMDIHDLRVYWISRGDHRYGNWQARTRFRFHSSPADTCDCNVPLGFVVVYAEDKEGTVVSPYDEHDLTIPPSTTPTSFVLDVTHDYPGSPGAQCPNP